MTVNWVWRLLFGLRGCHRHSDSPFMQWRSGWRTGALWQKGRGDGQVGQVDLLLGGSTEGLTSAAAAGCGLRRHDFGDLHFFGAHMITVGTSASRGSLTGCRICRVDQGLAPLLGVGGLAQDRRWAAGVGAGRLAWGHGGG